MTKLITYIKLINLFLCLSIPISALAYENEKFLINGSGENIKIIYKACTYIDNQKFCKDSKPVQLSKGEKYYLRKDLTHDLKKIEGSIGMFEYKPNSLYLYRTVIERFGNKYFVHNAGF